MAKFTIFYNAESDICTAVYDRNLPTQTGIGIKKEWEAVYHGEAQGFLDKNNQCRAFAEGLKKGRNL